MKSIIDNPFVILSFLIIVVEGFSFIYWPRTMGNVLIRLVCVAFLISILILPINRECIFSRVVLLLTFYPIVSIFTASLMYGQGFIESIKSYLPHLIWLTYFILHKYKVKESTILKAFLYFSLIVVFLQVVQQFTYPNAFFGVLSKEELSRRGWTENIDIRNGLYRFLIHQNGYVAVVVMLYYLEKIKRRFSFHHFFVVVLMMVSIYLSLTRQVMASALFVLILSQIKGNNKLFSIVFLSILLLLGYLFFDNLFAALGEITQDDADNDNYVRLLCYVFYYEKICTNFVTFFLGSGVPWGSGPYMKLYDYWSWGLGFHTADIGIVGYWYLYGLSYVLLFLYVMYLCIFKFADKIPNYIRFTVLFTFFMCPMIFPFTRLFYYLFWSFIFYIIDLHINHKKISRVCHYMKLLRIKVIIAKFTQSNKKV